MGQGLAGTMLAFEMLDRNIDFRIVSSPQKSKASLVAAGMVNPLVFKRLTKSWMADELLPFMQERYLRLEVLLNETFYYQKQILKPLSEQETELWKTKKGQPQFASYIGEILYSPPVDGISPAFAYGIVKGAGYLNLHCFLKRAEDFFLKKGMLIYDDLQIDALTGKVSGGKSKELEAEKIIFCDGYHFYRNPLFSFVKMYPAKGELLLVNAPGLSENFILNKKAFVLPVGDKRFKVGSTYEWDDLSERTTSKGKESILERINSIIAVKYQVEKHWAGIRPTIADRRPVLGKHPQFSNLFVFNGLGTKGVMLAPFFAQKMCHFVNGDEKALSIEFNVNRFV